MAAKKEDKWAFFQALAAGLKQQPAYLLIFALAALFFLFAIGSASVAVLQSNPQLWLFAFGGLFSALIAAVVVIWRIQPPAPAPLVVLPDSNRDKKSLDDSQAVRVLPNNDAMFRAVSDLLDRSADEIKKVTVVQYSGVNVMSTVRAILSKTSAEIEVYFVNHSWGVNDHQKRRVKELAQKFGNELRGIRSRGHWRQFTYDAPGSIRAVLIEGHVLFVGAYQYEVVTALEPHVLDICGGEMPLLMVPFGHPGFQMLSDAIDAMVNNWKQEKDSKGHLTAIEYKPSLSENANA
jgi:hypothetical protein